MYKKRIITATVSETLILLAFACSAFSRCMDSKVWAAEGALADRVC